MECHENIGLTKRNVERSERRIKTAEFNVRARVGVMIYNFGEPTISVSSSAVSAFPALTLIFCQYAMERHVCINNSDCWL